MRKTLLAAFAAMLVAAVVIAVAPTGSDAANKSLDPATLGMRPSGGFLKADRLAQYERELDAQINWYVAMAGRQSPADMKGSVHGQLRNDAAVLPTISDRMNLVMTVPLAFGKQTAKTEAGRRDIRSRLLTTAKGEWDADFRVVAKALVDGGYPDAVIRLGHEFTGGWYPWSAQGNEDAYIAAYRHVHDVMAAISPDFRFEWNAARNTFVEYGPPAYPGDAYVDVVGLDVYYEPWKGDKEYTDAYWDKRYQTVLEAHQQFAQARGKPVSYAEWGNGGVDQPEFITAMHDWFASLPQDGGGSLLYHAYFNVNKALYDLDNYPASKREFIDLFGGGGAASGGSPADALPKDGQPDPVVVDVTTTSTTTPAPAPSPATTPTSTPAPGPAEGSASGQQAGAGQLTLFDQQVTHQADSYATMNFTKLADWSSPVDYTSGGAFVRLDITSKPSDREVQVLTCMWRDRFAQETCTSLGKYTEAGLQYVELPSVDRWWRKGKWDWDRPIDFVRLLVKDVKTGKLLNNRACGSVCYQGRDLADHTPIDFDAHMILVAKGQTLDVPGDWAGCPESWGGVCAGGGSNPTPGTTPPTTAPPATTPPTTEPSVDLPTLIAPSQVTAEVGQPITINIDSNASSFNWWKVRGPGGLKWGDRSAEDVEVEFLTTGTYELAVTARRNGRASRSRIDVAVSESASGQTTTTTQTTTTSQGTSPTTAPPSSGTGGTSAGEPNVSVRPASASEGSVLVFKLVLDGAATQDVVATVQTSDISAMAGEDYRSREVEVVIPAGSLRAFVGVPTFKDSASEGDETMRLRITEASGATIDTVSAKGKILNR